MHAASQTFRSFAIVPAAGRSQRMGAPKLLLPWQGRLLIEHVVGAWRQSGVDQVIVVVGPDNGPLAEVCGRLPCRLVVPATPPPDMKASVGRGLEYVAKHFSPASDDVWLVAPADLPALSAAGIDRVLSAHDPAQPAIVVPCHDGRRGHPALFPWPLAAHVFALAESESLKDLMVRFPLREIQAPAAAFEDLDTPQDYQRLQDRHIR